MNSSIQREHFEIKLVCLHFHILYFGTKNYFGLLTANAIFKPKLIFHFSSQHFLPYINIMNIYVKLSCVKNGTQIS